MQDTAQSSTLAASNVDFHQGEKKKMRHKKTQIPHSHHSAQVESDSRKKRERKKETHEQRQKDKSNGSKIVKLNNYEKKLTTHHKRDSIILHSHFIPSLPHSPARISSVSFLFIYFAVAAFYKLYTMYKWKPQMENLM